jgi:DNA-binding transcriptional regulator YiaG
MFRRLERYEETGIGLPYPVILINGAEELIDDRTGETKGISIRAMERMVAAVALSRALNPLSLDGSEIKFMRHVIGKTAKEFAENLCFSAETLSRWENNALQMGGSAEKEVRMAVVLALQDRVPGFSPEAKDVVDLKLRNRQPNQWPRIQLVCLDMAASCESSGGRDVSYDFQMAA